MKKPVIDREKCVGCGTCEALCPQVFKLDESGKAVVIKADGCDQDCCDCENVVASCPQGAISLR